MKLLQKLFEAWQEACELRARAARNHFRIAPTI